MYIYIYCLYIFIYTHVCDMYVVVQTKTLPGAPFGQNPPVKIWKVIFVFQPLEVLNTTGNEQVQRAKQALLFSLRRHMIGNAQGPCGPE